MFYIIISNDRLRCRKGIQAVRFGDEDVADGSGECGGEVKVMPSSTTHGGRRFNRQDSVIR